MQALTKEYKRVKSVQSRVDGINKNENLNIMIKFDDMTGENRQEYNPR